tara:strand:+ start:850 stop:1170 length:321 start_codon:yes stop_codon:yes gene_type:complete
MSLNHEAVLLAYPNACVVDDDAGAFDADGNPIELDLERVASFEQQAINDQLFLKLRSKRDRLLADTDWWALSDVTMTDEQTAYRQALRDVPANTTDPANPTWPTKP